MEHIIIGTAGHIDHGKTALIRALTGRDTDTLKEEKKRGITIDLGFTYFDLPNGSRAGVIDVPGHEKFLSNMLAGVCGMDLVLLVIALDEGIMPQTREHMEILRYLNIRQGILVLTKCDLVEPEWADMMEDEIRQELSTTIFAKWKYIRVSSVDRTGMDQLKEMIAVSSNQMERNRDTDGRCRLPVDRVMSLKGLGTVVAGTLLEGVLHVGTDVMLYPSGRESYIKSIQVHGNNVDKAFAGQRCAMLLSGVKKDAIKRGVVVAYPNSLRNADRLDVVIHMDSDTERKIKNQSRVHLYIGTSECVSRIVLLDKNELQKGEKAYAQLILEEELAVRKGDRFVLRFYSPLEIIGGGIILDECAVKHKRNDPEVTSYLRNKENNQDERILRQVIQNSGKPICPEEIGQFCKIEKNTLKLLLDELEKERECMVFQTKNRKFYWSYLVEDTVWEQVEVFLHQYHQEHRYRLGVEKTILKNHVFSKWEINRFDAYMLFCSSEGKLEAGNDGNSYHIVGEYPEMDEELEELESRLKKEFQTAGVNFRNVKDLVGTVNGHDFSIDIENFRDALQFLAVEKKVTRISDEFYTTNEIAEIIKENVIHYFEENEVISFASLRDLLGTSRRTAKPLMAYLDEQKITQWCGKETERKRYQWKKSRQLGIDK
ncbi:MAG: selenocysteine-specific translation elongation factor [Hespellia sp.]|nr:selenocysteine-specific translation elongation factor [Hespellia sp.]